MLKRLGRSHFVHVIVGALAAAYLRLVGATTRYAFEPADIKTRALSFAPFIVAMWHGQHFMIHMASPQGARVSALISRSGDGEINAQILKHLGVEAIRGSGGGGWKSRRKGGMSATREMLRVLSDGSSIALTADVPKVSRIAGLGIVTLAKMSGRPIVPVAVVSKRRVDIASWDSASVPLPFTRGSIVVGEPIYVAADADDATLETTRQQVEAAMNDVHARAYANIGSQDPGAVRRQAA
jgi:lysophospholipid acyltransferase (LPLAT)-like uncharacterized protein